MPAAARRYQATEEKQRPGPIPLLLANASKAPSEPKTTASFAPYSFNACFAASTPARGLDSTGTSCASPGRLSATRAIEA
jgi:hypothetical protein